jgi:hypothetical protein
MINAAPRFRRIHITIIEYPHVFIIFIHDAGWLFLAAAIDFVAKRVGKFFIEGKVVGLFIGVIPGVIVSRASPTRFIEVSRRLIATWNQDYEQHRPYWDSISSAIQDL